MQLDHEPSSPPGEGDYRPLPDIDEEDLRKMLPPAFVSTFVCPISRMVMRDPVSTADGQTYEREMIMHWLQSNNTSPLTGARLGNKTLTPNHSLRSMLSMLADSTQRQNEEVVPVRGT